VYLWGLFDRDHVRWWPVELAGISEGEHLDRALRTSSGWRCGVGQIETGRNGNHSPATSMPGMNGGVRRSKWPLRSRVSTNPTPA
jgi:hypothetical protein